MKIYTKSGDSGMTGLYGDQRVLKWSDRIDLIGEVDELNSAIGVGRSASTFLNGERVSEVDDMCHHIQSKLFCIGAVIASVDKTKVSAITPQDISHLEVYIDQLDEILPELRMFILPMGTLAASSFFQARAIARRCERKAYKVLSSEGEGVVPIEVAMYLNRLSDLLFMMARVCNLDTNNEHQWVPET